MALVIRSKTIAVKSNSSNTNSSIVDSTWETIDPNPDIHALFLHFNDTFFDGSLAGCEVRWSPRMTYCAGLCVYEGRGGLCSIRLSQPLLKFRPRKDLVETLLHEMIHAYLFVTVRDRDRDGHGPQFQAHMNRINSTTGTHISVYHNFNDEVAFHRQHWWRCKGSCRDSPPYFGYVKRATNRAPGPNDRWHAAHESNCGGEFEKIKEPDGYRSKKSKNVDPTVDSKSQPIAKKKKAKDVSGGGADDRFPGNGHVLGGGAKIRRIEDYFPAVKTKDDDGAGTSVSNHDDDSQGSPRRNEIIDDNPDDVLILDDDHHSRFDDEPGTSGQAKVDRQIDYDPWELEEMDQWNRSGASNKSTDHDGHQSKSDAFTSTACPVCQIPIAEFKINDHLDDCLTKSMLNEETSKAGN